MADGIVVTLRAGRGLLLGLVLLLAVPSVAFAGTDTVTSAADSGTGSLRAVIAASNPGDTINFDSSLDGQKITLTSGPLIITHGLIIAGPGSTSLTISGNAQNTVFDIVANTSSDDVTISDLEITDGAASGQGTQGGGGIFADSVHSLTLQNDVITNNTATITSASSAGGG